MHTLKHLAMIMDGNNRWAKQRGLAGLEGHRRGAESLRGVIKTAVELEIEVLTVYAFSSENWQRPAAEVAGLMRLLMESLVDEVPELHANGVQVRFIGELGALSVPLQARIQECVSLTQNNQGLVLVVAVNYGGRQDLVRAAKAVAVAAVAGELDPADLDEACLHQETCLSDLPPPDLCIRTSGEQRISNFLLWQLAYSELLFVETLWPDFAPEDLRQAVADFSARARRFGGK